VFITAYDARFNKHDSKPEKQYWSMQLAGESASLPHNSSEICEDVPSALPARPTRLSARSRLFCKPSALSGLAGFAENVTDGRDLNGGPYFAASLEAMSARSY
jgi:hypothetical protein